MRDHDDAAVVVSGRVVDSGNLQKEICVGLEECRKASELYVTTLELTWKHYLHENVHKSQRVTACQIGQARQLILLVTEEFPGEGQLIHFIRAAFVKIKIVALLFNT